MATDLPSSAELTRPPDWALARVPGIGPGAPPLRIERLGGGTVNQVFRVDSPQGRFVLRLDGASWRRPGVDRRRELELHRAASAAGAAPSLVDADPEAQGLLITQFHEGRCWSAADYEDAGALQRLGERLLQLHRVTPPVLGRFDPWRIAQNYAQRIAPPVAAELAPVLTRVQAVSAEIERCPPPDCIVHGDLWQGNVLQGDRIWLLDWEYAQVCDALMDIASVLAYYPAAERHRHELAAAAGLDLRSQRRELAQRVYLYRALAWLWHLARGETAEPP